MSQFNDDLRLISEAYRAVSVVIERWEQAHIPLSALPNDLAHLYSVADFLLSAQEKLKKESVQESLQAFYRKSDDQFDEEI